jgi:plastocyanin
MSRPFSRFALLVTFAAACGGGGEKPSAGSSAAAPPPNNPSGSAAAAPSGTAAPITGKTWDVKMIGDASGYHFDPASLTIKQGDGVRWTVVSGPPHNVTFWPDSIPSGSAAQLGANMPQPVSPMTSPMMANIGETYTASFGGVPPGTYHYYCTPHLALGMKGTIVVQ